MKRNINLNCLLFGLVVFLLSSGCIEEKSGDIDPDDLIGSDYFMKAKLDGIPVEFKDKDLLVMEIGSTIPGVFEASFSGAEKNSDGSGLDEVITLIIKDESPIGEKRYDFLIPFEENGFGLKGFILGYINSSENVIYSTDVDEEDSVLEITELTNTHVKGKFSGVIYDILSSTKKTVTEGEFYIKRNN